MSEHGTHPLTCLPFPAVLSPLAANYEVVVTYVSMTTNNAAYVSPSCRTGPKAPWGLLEATVSTAAAQVIAINITSLNPPNGLMQNAIGTASGYFAPMAATHWNVYVRQVPISVRYSSALPAELGANSDSNEDLYACECATGIEWV